MSLLFVYGTLRCKEVVETILGEGSFEKIYQGQAVMPHTEAFYVLAEDYPALVKSSLSSTQGLLFKVTDEELAKIFQYEDPNDYDLIEREVHREEAPLVKAKVFWPKVSLKENVDCSRPWSYDAWKEKVDLEVFLEKVRIWASC